MKRELEKDRERIKRELGELSSLIIEKEYEIERNEKEIEEYRGECAVLLRNLEWLEWIEDEIDRQNISKGAD